MRRRVPIFTAVALICALSAPAAVANNSVAPTSKESAQDGNTPVEEVLPDDVLPDAAADPGLSSDYDPGFEDGEWHMGWSARLFEAEQRPAARSAIAPMAVPIPPGVPGVDVSGWQGEVDWQHQWDLGKRFAIVKATEGVGFRNKDFNHQYRGSYDQGMIRGAYHFARPDYNEGWEEAEFFANNGGGWSPDGQTLPGVLDIEYGPAGKRCWGRTPEELVDWVEDFLTTYKRIVGREAMIYTNFDWWNSCTDNSTRFAKTNSLWVARYSSALGTLPGGWAEQAIWQYSDKPIDQNAFNGSLDQLRGFATNPGPYPATGEAANGVERLGGANRYVTAALVSKAHFGQASTVYIASGTDFPDALTVGPATARSNGPLLLTRERLSSSAVTELTRLKPGRIVVAGGPHAVQESTLEELRRYAPTVTRWSGKDRYATAAMIARRTHSTGAATAYVASGTDFPDSLAGGSAAAADGAPLLLTRPDRLPAATKSALEELGVEGIVILGGESAVANNVAESLAEIAPTTRIAGANRFETAAKIAQKTSSGSPTMSIVASGMHFPDALSGGALAAQVAAPLLLSRTTSTTATTLEELRRLAPEKVLALGGSSALSTDVIQQVIGAR